MMAYPMGLPAWDPVALCVAGEDGLDGTQAAAELLDAGEAQLWVAAKDFPKGQKVRTAARRRRSGANLASRLLCTFSLSFFCFFFFIIFIKHLSRRACFARDGWGVLRACSAPIGWRATARWATG
jgi:hypothetical protein